MKNNFLAVCLLFGATMVTGCGDNKEDTGALDDDTTIESVVEEETEEPTVTDSTIAEDTTVARPTEPVVVSPVDKTEADESEDVEVSLESADIPPVENESQTK